MPRTLKRNLNRTVRLEEEGDRSVVVKRFHSPGPLRRLADGRRAQREFEVLRELHELGLPVPAPRALRREGGHWEVVTEWLEDAFPLDDCFLGHRPWPAPPERIAVRLGELLARAFEVGLDHSDLHARNVLLDPRGRVFLVDFQHARLGVHVDARQIQRDLVHLCAGVREHASLRFRARFLLALWRRLPLELRDWLLGPASLAREVETRAREHHRRRVARRWVRWTRESGACRPFRCGPAEGFASRALASETVDRVCREGLDRFAPVREGRTEKRRLELELDGVRWLVVDGPRADVRLCWATLVRLHDHALPVIEPAILLEEPRPTAVFRLPDGSGPYDPLTVTAAARLDLARLLGGLHDRGLTLRELTPRVFRVSEDRAWFDATAELEPARDPDERENWRALIELTGLDPELSLREYLGARRGPRFEHAAVRARLEA